jgi:hypothetical protein
MSLPQALEIFGRYEDYRATNIAVFGLYRREYSALKEYEKFISKGKRNG